MKKFIPLLMLLSVGGVANAGGLSTRHQSSLQLVVEPQIVTQTRVGNSYSISGSNVNTTHTAAASGSSAVNGGVGILTYDDHGVGSVGTLAVTQSQGCSTNSSGTTTCTGGSFSFANSFTQGDAINGSSTTWGDITTYSGGTAGGGQPGTITNGHAITLDNGSGSTGTIGAGNSLTGQFVSEITIFD